MSKIFINRSGFTLIEVVIFILVVAVAVVPLIAVFGNIIYSSSNHLYMRTGVFLAQGLMEEITGREFDLISSEVIPEGRLCEDCGNFSAEIEVFFVRPDNLEMPSNQQTGLKRIAVRVKWDKNTVELVTLAARK